MPKYTASIQYNKETIERLDAAICSTFHFSRRVCYLMICLALILGGGIMGFGTTPGMLSLLMGCLLLPSVNSIKSRNARQILRVMDGRTMTMEYAFDENGFSCLVGDGKSEYSYDSIIRIVEEKEYLYLFQKKTQACMIDIATIPVDQRANFKAFITKKTGIQWTKPMTFRTFSLYQYQFNRRNTRPMQ